MPAFYRSRLYSPYWRLPQGWTDSFCKGPHSFMVVFMQIMRATLTQTVAGLLPKRTWQRAEKSGKRCPQNVDSNKINMIEKTLNQKAGGSIPPRPTSIKS
jgi:hypothetical protein